LIDHFYTSRLNLMEGRFENWNFIDETPDVVTTIQ
jgi:hypothetical protein